MRSSQAELRADFDRIVASAKGNRIVLLNNYGENRISLYSPLPPDEVDYGPLEEAFLYAKLKYDIDVEVAGGGFGCLKVVLNAEVADDDSGEQLDFFLRDEQTRACLDKAGVTYASFVSKYLLGQFESHSEFVFYYGTNRARRKSQNNRTFYGNADAKKLETGLVHVHVSGLPRRKEKLSMMRRVWQEVKRGVFGRNKKRSAEIAIISPLPDEETWQRFKKDAEGRQPLFFVHGFKTPFANCLENFALLLNNLDAYQMSPSILPIIYAWPGSPKLTFRKYPAATGIASRTKRYMLRMLEQIVIHAKDAAPNLMAHSHGAQLLISTLELKRESWGKVGTDNGDMKSIFNELILIAPDVDEDEFEQAHDEIGNMVRRTSVYFNREDLTLKCSSWLRNIGPRLGEGSSGLGPCGTDLIDTGQVSPGVTKHSYHMDANEVIYDLNKLLGGEPAAGRGPWIRPQDPDDSNSGNWMLIRPGES